MAVKCLRHSRSQTPLLYEGGEKSTYIIFCSLLLIYGAFLASGRFTVCLNKSGIGDMKKQYQPQDLNNCHTDHHLLPGETETRDPIFPQNQLTEPSYLNLEWTGEI